jgi:hypothetical protein
VPVAAPAAFAALGEGLAWIAAQLGPSEAQAGVLGGWPYGQLTESTPVDCDRVTPRANHFHLFDAMNVPWKGCVEARPHPLDLTDELPTFGRSDSFFVPYFWPDESDQRNHEIRNNYLRDTATMPSWVKNSGSATLRQAWVWKYAFGGQPNIDNASFLTLGPNAACPDPVVPLTSDRSRLLATADALRSYAASGTNIAEGLAWTWRMISPRFVPEAAPFDRRNKKYIILMTDGFNEVVPQEVNWNRSDYSAIGYAAKRRLGTHDLSTITQRLDERLAQVCRSVKNDDIQVFTVLYDPVGYTASSQVEALLSNCATSKDRHVFKATSPEDLVAAFRNIGNEISATRLSR